ncbi:MAG: dynamin family protein, partial [Planctomycetota bacterium]|nr:dynamin family protein [Planctomycetota bacterium]
MGRKSADERSLCDIPLSDAAVSRQHCLVQFLAGQWTIRDLESTNGVRLNGEPIEERIAIESNDIVTIGTTELIFQLGEGNHSEENKSSLKSESRILREEQEILEKLLRTSLEELDSFLDEATDDEAIAWLRESAKHTIESQQHSTDQPLRVALLGEFSSGKTRLINALLGEKILSTGIVPVTRSVTRIVHGDEISVTVRHVDGTEMEVGVDQLKAYTDERKKEEGASEVDEVILRHPSPLLKKVEIWDTPGFNSNNQLHDQVASQLMLEADAVLWVIAGHQVGSRSETKLLETVKRAQGKVVGVLNQVDRLENEEAIARQKKEVWTHYGEMVKEVVTTSGKWLEQDHPGGNRERLLAHIDAIGAWSQEQRQRRTARRVAAVAAQGKAYLRLVNEEAMKIEEQQLQHDKQLKAQHQISLDLWKEALEHRDQMHAVRTDQTDQWFKSHCAYRAPLTLAYRALLREELTLEGYTALIHCLHTLEETHWHVSPHDPVPWRDDFLLSWRKGMDRFEVSQEKPLFHSAGREESPAASWLQQLTGIKNTAFPLRWAGISEAGLGKVQDVFSRVTALPEVEEVSKWWQDLDELELQRKPSSASPWLKRVRAATAAVPARKFHCWVELEARVSDLTKNYSGPLARILKQMSYATKRSVKLEQELIRFRKIHAIHRFVTGTLRLMLRISSFVMRKDKKASSKREFLF